ncbi:hypothetical protein Hanom_Chr13g01239471 [Helianthus anomalus]
MKPSKPVISLVLRSVFLFYKSVVWFQNFQTIMHGMVYGLHWKPAGKKTDRTVGLNYISDR